MKQIQITPDIVQLTRLGLVNCFLIREEDGLTLVDTMIPGSASAIVSAANTLNRSFRRVLLTHVHGDHVGSLNVLASRLAHLEIALGRRESRFLARDFQLEPNEPQTKVRGSFPKVDVTPSALLSDGEVYGSLLVIATPGHTPGHLAFLDTRSGTLISGDALTGVGGVRVAGDAPARFPLPNFGTWHRPTALESARKLLQLGPKQIVFGHGRPVLENATAALKEAIRRIE